VRSGLDSTKCKLTQVHCAFLNDLLERRTELYLDEIVALIEAEFPGLTLDESTLCRTLQKWGFTRKKVCSLRSASSYPLLSERRRPSRAFMCGKCFAACIGWRALITKRIPTCVVVLSSTAAPARGGVRQGQAWSLRRARVFDPLRPALVHG
jgi:hypothetical protein